MFWRFGFHNPSAVDTLLEREDVTLEEVLEEEELLQEAKSHNQKLVNFLCQPANCEKLLHYITSNTLEEGQKYKYPFLSSEIMACEIPQLIEMIILEQKELLETFWQFLDRPSNNDNSSDDSNMDSVDPSLDTLLASYFAKTITIFLTKQPAEMLEFIESRPENLNKILNHLDSSAIMDLLLTLVRMEELPEGKGIVQWLSDGGLMENLVNRLDPYLDTEEHSVAQQCICEIIRMSQTSLLEQPSIGLNDLVIKLKSEAVMRKLTNFMLDPNAPNATSTLINGVTIIIDLIRHNNSDMENDPMLNTTYGSTGNNDTLRPISVSLADMLKVLAEHVMDFNQLLIEPRSVTQPIQTSIGEQMPLGFERLKICELFAELLHCSNMSNLNAVGESDRSPPLNQDEEDEQQHMNHSRIATNPNDDQNKMDKSIPENLQAELDEESPASVTMATTETTNAIPSTTNNPSTLSEESKHEETEETTVPATDGSGQSPTETSTSTKSSTQALPMGDYLKLQLVLHKVLPTCTNLFFCFPWNNFLHYVIYDMLHQVFNGRMDKGYNRLLALSILKDGQLTTKMVEAQKKNDTEWAKPKGMRLGYMGHLTFIADEVIKLFEGYPEAIVQDIKDVVDLDLWYQYCENELRETKERDCLPLGGDRPIEDDTAMREEDDEEEELDGGTASQYSRYLAQREADGSLEEDEDDAHWITGRNDNMYDSAFNDGHNQESGMDDEREYDSDEEEGSQAITQDWSRGFTEFPQANMLRRTQSRVEDDYDDGEEYDPFSITDITPRQPPQQRNMNFSNEGDHNDANDDDDAFGEFASSDSHGFQDDDDTAWGASTSMEQLAVSSDDNKEERSVATETRFNDGFGTETASSKATAPPPSEQSAASTLSKDLYVSAVKTREEEEKQKRDYQSGQDEEQKGEI